MTRPNVPVPTVVKSSSSSILFLLLLVLSVDLLFSLSSTDDNELRIDDAVPVELAAVVAEINVF
jgi:hypothetical protein